MDLRLVGIAILLLLVLSLAMAYPITNSFCYPKETKVNDYVWIKNKLFYAPQHSWLRNYADDQTTLQALQYYKTKVWVNK